MSNKKVILKELQSLDKLNHAKAIKLRYKELSDGRLSLYLDYWNGAKREYQFLKIYLSNKVTSKTSDLNNLKLAVSIREKREIELLQQSNDFELKNWKREANFIDFFQSICREKPATEKAWNNTLKHLRDFQSFIKIKDVTSEFIESLRDYFLSKVSSNTAHTYLSKIKASLNLAVNKKIITFNPANGIQIKKKDAKREFLTVDEVKQLYQSELPQNEVKQAFIFSCFTGLRLSDVKKLTFENIQDGILSFTQQKTNGHERIKLNKTALTIVEAQRELKQSGKVFDLPTNITETIKKWTRSNGINKHITFHCSRHTFATMNITVGNGLLTTSKLLGHKDIKTTQIYAKLIDKKKDEAIDKLPEF